MEYEHKKNENVLKTNLVGSMTRVQSHCERSACHECFDKLSNHLLKGSNLNAAEDEVGTRLQRSQLWDCFVTSFLAMTGRQKSLQRGCLLTHPLYILMHIIDTF